MFFTVTRLRRDLFPLFLFFSSTIGHEILIGFSKSLHEMREAEPSDAAKNIHVNRGRLETGRAYSRVRYSRLTLRHRVNTAISQQQVEVDPERRVGTTIHVALTAKRALARPREQLLRARADPFQPLQKSGQEAGEVDAMTQIRASESGTLVRHGLPPPSCSPTRACTARGRLTDACERERESYSRGRVLYRR